MSSLRPPLDAQPLAWNVGGTSVRGVGHLREDLPNQDALATWRAPSATGLPAIVAVADGHGGARHFRSATGASLAVESTVAILRALAADMDPTEAGKPAYSVEKLATDLPSQIVAHWTERVRQHFDSAPFTPSELAAVVSSEGVDAGESVRRDPLLAYGSTLLAALVTTKCVVLTQLGDGDIIAVATDGNTTRPVPVDERLIGNRTTSLCQPSASTDFRTVVLSSTLQPLALLLLATDGYGNSFKTDGDFLKVGGDLLEMIQVQGFAAVEKRLTGFLEHASTNGSGDDITVGLLHQRTTVPQSAQAAVLTTATPPMAQPTGPQRGEVSALRSQLGAARAESRRLKWTVAGAVLAAIVIAGWAFSDRWPAGWTAVGPAIKPPVTESTKKGEKQPSAEIKPETREPPAPPIGAPASGQGSGGGLVSGGVEVDSAMIREVRAKAVSNGVDVRVTLRLDGLIARPCDVEATLIGPRGRELGVAHTRTNAEPGIDATAQVRIGTKRAPSKEMLALTHASVKVNCGPGRIEERSAPLAQMGQTPQAARGDNIGMVLR